MKKIILSIVIICALALITLSISCTITPFTSTSNKSASEVIVGSYYLDSDIDRGEYMLDNTKDLNVITEVTE